MIAVFDLGGPLLAYGLLRSAGMSAVAALILSGVLPALGIAVGALVDRRLDVIGTVVLAGLAIATVLGLTSHNARLYLLEGSVPSVVFALGCLLSLRLRQPLIYRLAVELLGPGPRARPGPQSARRRTQPGPPIHSSGASHADRHQRLPAPPRRHPVVRARAGHPAARRHGDRVRARVEGRGGVRREAAVPGHQAPVLADAAGTRRVAPGRRHRQGARLRRRPVRRGGAARPHHADAAQGGGGDPGGRADARPRGRLGRAARCPRPAAPHRRRGGRGHLPGRVLPGTAGPRAVPGGTKKDDPAGTRRGHDVLPPRRGPPSGPPGGQGPAGAERQAGGALRVPDGPA